MHPHIGALDWPTAYGVMLVLACVTAGWFARARAAAAGWDASHLDFALPAALLAGVLGTKLMSVLVFHRFLLFALLLIAALVLVAYGRWVRLPIAKLCDVLAPPVLLWIACLRVGCFLGGCCWGDVVARYSQLSDSARSQIDTLPAIDSLLAITAVRFPVGSFAARQHESLGLIEAGSSLPVVPTQLFEAGAAIALLLVALRMERRLPTPGALALWVLASYATARFGIEFLRADNPILVFGLTGNQFVCVLLVSAAALLVVHSHNFEGISPR
jgi:phosphatidylglycerol:prolipoprotein diacylglycerol transferase